tara:strand:- start:13926 stop:14639 length:714 start_codon:yes stop_codon:yes gene_type:complete
MKNNFVTIIKDLEAIRMPVAKLKCKCHGEYQLRESLITTPKGKFCSYELMIKWADEQTSKRIERENNKAKQVVVKKEKAFNSETKRLKETIKPKSKWLAEAQAAFNKYIRIRDYLDPCIACLKPREIIEAEQAWKTGGCWDAGHFKTRGAKGQLRFILFNVHKQCKSCNGVGGKFSAKAATVDANYRINLIDKIGIDKVEWLDNNNDIDLKKGDIEHLKRVKRIFTKRAKFYEKRLL